MNTLFRELNFLFSETFKQNGYDETLGTISMSRRPDLCDFQCNGALAGAKKYKKKPMEIAEEIVNSLESKKDTFKKIEAINPGFINITLNDDYLLNFLKRQSTSEELCVPQSAKKKTIVIDYGGPNVAKPLHVGHLRSAIIGESLKRLAKAMGHNVISDVHLGDWGLQMGLVIAGLQEKHPELQNNASFKMHTEGDSSSTFNLTAEELNEVYPYASKKSKEDPAFKSKADYITCELQNGNPQYVGLWKKIIELSIGDLRENYAELGVEFDFWYGESDSAKYIGQLMERLEAKDLVYRSEGALVVDVAEPNDTAPIPPVIVKKSDNSNIYATTDLATIIQRQEEFQPNEYWYVVDARQSLHFQQVFRCAYKAQLVDDTTKLEHLGFGTMNGNDGKPYKTRDGGVMRLSDFLDVVFNAAVSKEDLKNNNQSEIRKAKKISIAAIKFGDLSNHRLNNYIFDLDKFMSFEGKTGVYLLYTITRINSLFRRCGVTNEKFIYNSVFTQEERKLILTLILSEESFIKAFDEREPCYICESAYSIATGFSEFYHNHSVLREETFEKKSSWLALCDITRKYLIKHLEILGIEHVDSM